MRLARSSQRPNLPWSFAVLDSPAVNAFALPGGFIYITRGILPYLDNEAQLVGVLGHEIGHVTARHSAQQYTRGMGASLGVLVGSIFVPQVASVRRSRAGRHRRAVPQVRPRRRAAGRRAGRRVHGRRRVGSRRGAEVPDDARADCGDDGSQRRAELDVDASAARESRGARRRNREESADCRRGQAARGRSIATATSRASTASSLATIPKTASCAATCFCIRRCASRSSFRRDGRSPTATSRSSRRSRGTRCSWCCAPSRRGRDARSIRWRSSTCASPGYKATDLTSATVGGHAGGRRHATKETRRASAK